MSIRISRVLKFGDIAVTINELTVAEIRAWIAESGTPIQQDREYDIFTDVVAFDGISVQDMRRFSNITDEVVAELSPSHLQRIAAVIKELNSVFFSQYLPALEKLRAAAASLTLNEEEEIEDKEKIEEAPQTTAVTPSQTTPEIPETPEKTK